MKTLFHLLLNMTRWSPQSRLAHRRRAPLEGQRTCEMLEVRALLSPLAAAEVSSVSAKSHTQPAAIPDYSGKWNIDTVKDGVAIFTQNGPVVTSILSGNEGLFPGVGTVNPKGKVVFHLVTTEFGTPFAAKITLKLTSPDSMEGTFKGHIPFLGKLKAPVTATRV